MPTPQTVSDPRSLRGLYLNQVHQSRVNTNQDSTPPFRQAKLALLHPLSKADILESCRCRTNPPTDPQLCRYTCDRFRHEFLNLHPLGKMWREELMKIPPFSHLIFDLTLPPNAPNDNNTEPPSRWIYWDISMPQESSLGIHDKEVMNIVKTIALTTRIRTKSGNVSFDVVYDPTDGAPVKTMKALQQQLGELSTATSPSSSSPQGGDIETRQN
ncbi:hypothetical protein AnigIFM56816_000891 [Aspergillus niger]|nr:hypothetical protein AnigIFM56816_000891 [Aspergillus niger]